MNKLNYSLCGGTHQNWNPLVTHHMLLLHWYKVPLLHTPRMEMWAHSLNRWPHLPLHPSPHSKCGPLGKWHPCPALGQVQLGWGRGGGHWDVLRGRRWTSPCLTAEYRPCAAYQKCRPVNRKPKLVRMIVSRKYRIYWNERSRMLTFARTKYSWG